MAEKRSILNRITTILRANVNDMLDRAEDPEKMLNQFLRDLQEAIAEARSQVAEALAAGKLQEADLKQARLLAAEWQRKAELAVQRGAKDLARECLQRKRDYETNAQLYEQQVAALQPGIQTLRRQQALLEAKLRQTESSRSMLLARHRVAQARQKMQEAVSSTSGFDPNNVLQSMERRIRIAEARADAGDELAGSTVEAQLAALEAGAADIEIEAELLELEDKVARRMLPPGE